MDQVAATPKKRAENGLLRRQADVEREEIAATAEKTLQIEVMVLPDTFQC